MPETILITPNDQLLTTTIEDMYRHIDERHQSTDTLSNTINQKQKSLISVYDNNLQHQCTSKNYPLVGIIGQNKRSQAFRKRLLLSGFPSPILCDINSDSAESNYISYELFYELSPTIILITDDLTINFEDLFPQTKQQLVIDTRELSPSYFSRKARALPFSSIPGSYRAFGNLSDQEIEHGTQRARVAIEEYSPSNLIAFIYSLNCFPRGIDILEHETYNHTQRKLIGNCLFPLLATVFVFTLCLIISATEHSTDLIYRQAGSITAATSITLLALLYLIRPLLDMTELIYSWILKSQNLQKNTLPNLRFLHQCFQSQNYLIWYSLAFALLHLVFLMFSKLDLTSNMSVNSFFFGLFTMVALCILSCVHFPWISEHLLWKEYHFLTSHLGLFCLLFAVIHPTILHWNSTSGAFDLKAFSLILPMFVLILRLIIYGLIYPIQKLIQWTKQRQNQTSITPTRDASMFL
ncbi:unnamed protein product [Adineta ricciae]|nr:unnamed protein product [Adineta ricciae]